MPTRLSLLLPPLTPPPRLENVVYLSALGGYILTHPLIVKVILECCWLTSSWSSSLEITSLPSAEDPLDSTSSFLLREERALLRPLEVGLSFFPCVVRFLVELLADLDDFFILMLSISSSATGALIARPALSPPRSLSLLAGACLCIQSLFLVIFSPPFQLCTICYWLIAWSNTLASTSRYQWHIFMRSKYSIYAVVRFL